MFTFGKSSGLWNLELYGQSTAGFGFGFLCQEQCDVISDAAMRPCGVVHIVDYKHLLSTVPLWPRPVGRHRPAGALICTWPAARRSPKSEPSRAFEAAGCGV